LSYTKVIKNSEIAYDGGKTKDKTEIYTGFPFSGAGFYNRARKEGDKP